MTISSEVSSHVDDVLCAQARDYLSRVLAEMAAPQIAHTPVDLPAGGDLALTIFDVLTSRRFCDLGRRKAQAAEKPLTTSPRLIEAGRALGRRDYAAVHALCLAELAADHRNYAKAAEMFAEALRAGGIEVA